jgi:hypothetical protein
LDKALYAFFIILAVVALFTLLSIDMMIVHEAPVVYINATCSLVIAH